MSNPVTYTTTVPSDTLTTEQIKAMRKSDFTTIHFGTENGRTQAYVVAGSYDDRTNRDTRLVFDIDPEHCTITDYRKDVAAPWMEKHTVSLGKFDPVAQTILSFLRAGDRIAVKFTIADDNLHCENAGLHFSTANVVIFRGKKRYEFMVAAGVRSPSNIATFRGVSL
jgi:precorrin-2 methylase